MLKKLNNKKYKEEIDKEGHEKMISQHYNRAMNTLKYLMRVLD